MTNNGGELLSAPDEAEAVELLHELGCTDGLPVIVPTPERVERMALASGLDPDLTLGDLGPGLGSATVGSIAASAVMAGCLPDYMPIVIAAVRAVADPTFDLTEMQATTHDTAPLIIVNGPVIDAVGLHGGFGALGPGFRANASIGRALRLVMINVGGGRAGESDMALLGHPGKFTYCMAESERASPWEPFHVSRGFDPMDSTVTVIGAEAPHSVITSLDVEEDPTASRVIDALAGAFANLATNNAVLRGGAAMVVVNPDHAAALAAGGLTRADVAQGIFERAVNTRSTLAERIPGMTRPGQGDDVLACFTSPDDVCVIVGGGGGLYSTVMPSWCAGPHKNRAITVAVELDQACEIPAFVDAQSTTAGSSM